jgi:hypothetical protein
MEVEREMTAEERESCVKPAKGPVAATDTAEAAPEQSRYREEELKVTAKVGKPAPDFELSAFVDGGFKNVKLSDYSGQWVVLCFYPGDFTFV